MQWIRETKPDPKEKRYYHRAIWITLIGNLLLLTSKGIVAYFSNSTAIYADAANSAADMLYSVLMVFGLTVVQQPPDGSHPQGHSRFEPVTGLLIALGMGFAGYEAARAAVERFNSGGLAIQLGLPTLVLLFSAAVKGSMYISIQKLAQQLYSPSLNATARDNLNDILTSAAAFIGVFGSNYLHPLLDPIAGFVVALWIFKSVYEIAKDNLRYLTGAGAESEIRENLRLATKEVPEVLGVNQLITEYVGPKLMVDLHVNVDGTITLYAAHEISDRIQAKLQDLPYVDRAYVHLEPCEREEIVREFRERQSS